MGGCGKPGLPRAQAIADFHFNLEFQNRQPARRMDFPSPRRFRRATGTVSSLLSAFYYISFVISSLLSAQIKTREGSVVDVTTAKSEVETDVSPRLRLLEGVRRPVNRCERSLIHLTVALSVS